MSTHELTDTREAWDDIAAGYDEFVTPTHMWLGNEALSRVGLAAGMRFLDVAAGSGALSIPAAHRGARVTATDISPAMVARLEARARAEGCQIETRVMDGHALALEDGAFDVAGSQYGVMLFPDLARALGEMVRVTKPGGRVFLVVYGPPAQVEFLGFFMGAIQAVVPGFTGPTLDPPPLPFQVADAEKTAPCAGRRRARADPGGNGHPADGVPVRSGDVEVGREQQPDGSDACRRPDGATESRRAAGAGPYAARARGG